MNLIASNSGAEDGPNPAAADISHQAQGYQGKEQLRESPAHSANQSGESAHNDSGPGNIDKIRDIIFGSQMRDYEQRFGRLEEALRKESSDLRETTRKHLEVLESFVRKEVAALENRLNIERDERTDNQTRMAGELTATSASIDGDVVALTPRGQERIIMEIIPKWAPYK
jgi:hypothetical protein